MASGALIISTIAAVAGAVQQRKAAKEQRRQNRVSNRIAANRRSRDIRRSIAARRVQVAAQQSSGFALGVQGGTAVQGAVSGVVADTASAIGAANQQFTGQQVIAASQNRISQYLQNAGTYQAIGSIAGQFTGGVGSVGAQNRAAVADLFGG
jgi:hypothetical protein